MKYTFGVMSNKYELESDDMTTAYISMAVFIGKNMPIAVYSPQTYAFMPKDILEANKGAFNPEKVKKCIKNIKEVTLCQFI
jgi:hypothetical protein